MNKFLERLNTGEILVADGATGTNLQAMGIKPTAFHMNEGHAAFLVLERARMLMKTGADSPSISVRWLRLTRLQRASAMRQPEASSESTARRARTSSERLVSCVELASMV